MTWTIDHNEGRMIDSFLLAYAGRPVVTSSCPASGPAHGGMVVQIQGALDSRVTAVDFGSTPATILQLTAAAAQRGQPGCRLHLQDEHADSPPAFCQECRVSLFVQQPG